MRHVILRGFEGEKDWRLIGMSKTSRFCRDRPEQIADAPGKSTAERSGGHFPACAAFGAVEQIEVWLLHGPLRGEHQDRFAGHTLREQVTHPFDARGGFARAHGARDEEFRVRGEIQ